VLGAPDELDALAERLQQMAAAVRHRATLHQQHSSAARWVSTAASAYRRSVHTDCASASRSADALEHAAADLRAHAEVVRERITLLTNAREALLDGVVDVTPRLVTAG